MEGDGKVEESSLDVDMEETNGASEGEAGSDDDDEDRDTATTTDDVAVGMERGQKEEGAPGISNGNGVSDDPAAATDDDAGQGGEGSDESDEDEEDEDEQEDDDEDEGSMKSSSHQTGSENLVMASPSSKTNISNNTSENESDVSDSKSNDASPAKRRRITNPNLAKNLQHYRHLRTSKEPFLQDRSCQKLFKKNPHAKKNKKVINKKFIPMCIDCKIDRMTEAVAKKLKDAPICRFYQFRKLYYSTTTCLRVFGFPDGKKDTQDSDRRLWLPEDPPERTGLELAQFLLQKVGDQFCDLVKQENETLEFLEDQQEQHQEVIWRRVVLDLREMCDVCHTTLFNFHWTCGKCGFVVCISCFKARKQQSSVPERESTLAAEKDDYGWPKCHKHIGEHELEKLMATQIIPGDILNEMLEMLQSFRNSFGSNDVASSSLTPPSAASSLLLYQYQDPAPAAATSAGDNDQSQSQTNGIPPETNNDSDKENGEGGEDDDDDDDLMDLIGGPGPDDSDSDSNNQNEANGNGEDEDSAAREPRREPDSIPDKISSADEAPPKNNGGKEEMVLTNFVRRGYSGSYTMKVLPKNILTTKESQRRYPNTPHSWLCKGYLLRLEDPTNPGNLKMFQEQWDRGQPVIVSNVASNLTKDIWTPESFSKDFGHKSNPLINCMSGKILPSQKIKTFWDGFEHMKKRLIDEDGVPMLLKLKDWPPGEDFANVSPERFEDLMKALPLGEYTHRDGDLNLAARLPKVFSRPDLGPKMYIAYGSGLHLDKGTTNLHLDISDAVNVMVHVGEVQDEDVTEHRKAVVKAIEESDCDIVTINRVRQNKELPGALWHIWEAKDADKIRDLINKVSFEDGVKVEPHHDPIHDQSVYLDQKLRRRLMEEYNVGGYPIVQCAGDSVFIPAGAPHQVRNLNNCIKIAEDFVSPENVGHCFHLTEEFRNLTETHTNHEDKLQIKNIVYHTVKDALAVIKASLKKTDSVTNSQQQQE